MSEHTMSMYASKDDLIAALQSDLTAERAAKEAAEAERNRLNTENVGLKIFGETQKHAADYFQAETVRLRGGIERVLRYGLDTIGTSSGMTIRDELRALLDARQSAGGDDLADRL